MRFVVARRTGLRGIGFGNEVFPLAKGWIASQVLDAKLIGPSWGLSKYRYDRLFSTSRFDYLSEELFLRLPRHDFTEADYRATGEIDFGRAIAKWAREKGLLDRQWFIVTVAAMWGGYASIWQARSFLSAKLLNSKDALRNTFKVMAAQDPQKLFVAIHFRAGRDVPPISPNENLRGKFVVRLPLEWYYRTCESLQNRFGKEIQFHILSDHAGAEFNTLVEHFNPGQKREAAGTELSDLLLLTQADLRVCSVSSYSMLASFLADGPYVWYEPQLARNNGALSLWGHEEAQSVPGGLTYEHVLRAQAVPRTEGLGEYMKGFPVCANGALSEGLLRQLDLRLLSKNRAIDLLQYGAVPEWMLPTAQKDIE